MTKQPAEREIIWDVRYVKRGEPCEGGKYLTSERDLAAAIAKVDHMNLRAASMNLDAVYFTQECDVTEAFKPPVDRLPRDRFTQKWEKRSVKPGAWNVTDVTITDADCLTFGYPPVARYTRAYPGKPPFEPFRQRDAAGTEHCYALIAPDYQATSVIALDGPRAGDIIAHEDREERRDDGKPGYGFCPVGFYVPDWWDVHDNSIIPGSEYWEDQHDRWPDGTLGFVWGCYWGDDNGWKVQALDLSRVSDGIITRDDRFGYVYLDISKNPRDFIRIEPGHRNHAASVTFSVPRRYEVTGKLLHTGASLHDEDE